MEQTWGLLRIRGFFGWLVVVVGWLFWFCLGWLVCLFAIFVLFWLGIDWYLQINIASCWCHKAVNQLTFLALNKDKNYKTTLNESIVFSRLKSNKALKYTHTFSINSMRLPLCLEHFAGPRPLEMVAAPGLFRKLCTALQSLLCKYLISIKSYAVIYQFQVLIYLLTVFLWRSV